jgi:hypothetical protein
MFHGIPAPNLLWSAPALFITIIPPSMIPETFTTTTDTTTSSSSSPADAAVLLQQPFPESILDLDDYRGVTIRFDRAEATATTRRWTNHLDSGNSAATTFRQELQDALTLWRMEGKRGIWMHVPQDMAFVVPVSSYGVCVCALGEDFIVRI